MATTTATTTNQITIILSVYRINFSKFEKFKWKYLHISWKAENGTCSKLFITSKHNGAKIKKHFPMNYGELSQWFWEFVQCFGCFFCCCCCCVWYKHTHTPTPTLGISQFHFSYKRMVDKAKILLQHYITTWTFKPRSLMNK